MSHRAPVPRLERPGTLQSQPLPSVALPLPVTGRHTPDAPDVSQALPEAQSLEVWHSVAQVPSLAQRYGAHSVGGPSLGIDVRRSSEQLAFVATHSCSLQK